MQSRKDSAPLSLDFITLSVCQLFPYRHYSDGESVGGAKCSGFLWRYEGEIYVVTNWHCLTGINPESLKPLGSYTPNKCRVSLSALTKSEGDAILSYFRRFDLNIDLFDGEKPKWIEHPMGSKVDMCLFPLGQFETDVWKVKCLNDLDLSDWWTPSVSSDCYIAGYPEGISSEGSTPIWKRGSIATEPELDHSKQPIILVDSLTNPGMSGSPVIAKSHEIFRSDVPDDTIGPWRQILGVYSGRLGETGVGFQLGRVWKAYLIDEVLANPRPGRMPTV